MACGTVRCSLLTTQASLMTALVLCASGTFINKWWIDSAGKELGLFARVRCDGGHCVLATDGQTEVWVTTTQAMALVELVMLAVAMITTFCLFRSDSKFTSTIGIAFISVACITSLIQIFVLSAVYHKISAAVVRATYVPNNMVLYQTLPAGLCALSGIACIPAAIALIYWQSNKTGTRKAIVI
ncbi:hypothetical protein DPMN_037743 [Dreissena polymorpha]|uniref:Uncharacterized protein n=2 Tax=Dreissena polymorpha TaxID=45954 RepID=A0A9D4RPH0_DREPO|nr:hypothetical protein DPMN_037743 [Dreissena polymorpha]